MCPLENHRGDGIAVNRNDRSIVGFVMLAHAMVHTFELSIPILMLLWVSEFTISFGQLAVVVSVGYALFGLGALPAGILTDVFGSHRLIMGCLLGMGGSFLLISLAPELWAVAGALILWGLAASIYHPAGLTLISKGVERRGSAFAYHGMAGNTGIALGPLLTAVLLLVLEWRLVAALLTIPAFLGVALALIVDFDETAGLDSRRERGEADDGPDGPTSSSDLVGTVRALFASHFAIVFVIVLCAGLFYRGTLTMLPELLTELLGGLDFGRSLFEPGSPLAEEFEPSRYVYVGLLMIGIAGQYTGGKLTDRMRTERGLAIAFGVLVVTALAYVPMANAGVAPLLLASGVLGFTLFVIQPLYQATIAEYTPAEARGLSYGFTYLGVFGIGAAGAAVAGLTYDAFGIGPMFAVLASFVLIASLLSLWLLRR